MAILAFQKPVIQPAMRIITAITNSNPALVTTSFAHQYATGLIVRLDIAPGYGMLQANQEFGTITVTSPTTFTIPIDTTYYDAFVIPSSFPQSYQSSQCVPFGEDNSILTQAVRNVLPYTS